MKLVNNTPIEAFYGIHGGGGGDCGTIPANGNVSLPWYDNKDDVIIYLSAIVPKTPPGESGPFSITIPKSKKGMTVTMGLFQR